MHTSLASATRRKAERAELGGGKTKDDGLKWHINLLALLTDQARCSLRPHLQIPLGISCYFL